MRVQSEYPELTKRFFAEHGVQADVRLSYGATEAKIPDIADCVVEITETGRALRAAGLKVIDTILTSYTEVVANADSAADPDKRRAMDQVMTLLNGVLDARGKVLLKLNVSERESSTPPRRAPVDEVADDLAARRRRLRGRDGRREAVDQPDHPRDHRGRRHRSARIADLEDRAVNGRIDGTVVRFDVQSGLGEVAGGDGTSYPFHCIEIADGSRDIAVGTGVDFALLPKLGRYEAADIRSR